MGVVVALALAACEDDDRDMDGGPSEADAGARTDATPDAGGPVSEDAGDERDGGSGGCVPVEVEIGETCPALTACGGALREGRYCFDGLCLVRDELLAPLRPFCATIEIADATGTVSGSMVLRDGEAERASVTRVRITALFPPLCVVNGCDEVGTLIETQVPGSTATCAPTEGCRCAIDIVSTIDLVEPYTVDPAAGTLTIGSGDAEREHDYCVDGESGGVRFGAFSVSPEG